MDSNIISYYISFSNVNIKNMDRIITNGWPEDNEILLDEVSCTYVQNPDCTEDRDGNGQTLEISSRDGGGGKFIHIKTDGWSISDETDLDTLIKDFKFRAGINE
jgi:hypothetical protein